MHQAVSFDDVFIALCWSGSWKPVRENPRAQRKPHVHISNFKSNSNSGSNWETVSREAVWWFSWWFCKLFQGAEIKKKKQSIWNFFSQELEPSSGPWYVCQIQERGVLCSVTVGISNAWALNYIAKPCIFHMLYQEGDKLLPQYSLWLHFFLLRSHIQGIICYNTFIKMNEKSAKHQWHVRPGRFQKFELPLRMNPQQSTQRARRG